MEASNKNTKNKGDQQRKKRKQRREKAKLAMLNITQFVGLVPVSEPDSPNWQLLSDSRERLMRTDEKETVHYVFAQMNWRFSEVHLILHMLAKKWLKLDELNSDTLESYAELNETLYTVRVLLGNVFDDPVAKNTPMVTDPKMYADQLPRELIMISKVGGSERVINLDLARQWYVCMTAAVVGMLRLSSYHSLDVAVPLPPDHFDSPRDQRTFTKNNLLDFVTFREIEDFPLCLQKWTNDNMTYLAAEQSKFNYQEAYDFMQERWDSHLYE